MVEMLKEKGYAHYDEGALVVDVQEETDKRSASVYDLKVRRGCTV